jgi:hypothetical protein
MSNDENYSALTEGEGDYTHIDKKFQESSEQQLSKKAQESQQILE